MRIKTAGMIVLTLLAMAGLYNYTSAFISSRIYRIMISEQATVGNSAPKTGGAYSLLGSSGQLGSGSLSGGRYTVNSGIVNSWRPAQLSVSSSHVYPNPCTVSRGCTGVTFTRLTLRATIKIYTVSGEKVRTILKSNNIDSVGWDLRNEAGSIVASGLYLYVVTGEGTSRTGKLVIVR
ncbi:MAG: T9SS type A sorting domain-containing protein [Elusimicrobia bacterium]|nr:T9SS type A sorting domain-containing protein [Elusimicrobiota bacterium]